MTNIVEDLRQRVNTIIEEINYYQKRMANSQGTVDSSKQEIERLLVLVKEYEAAIELIKRG